MVPQKDNTEKFEANIFMRHQKVTIHTHVTVLIFVTETKIRTSWPFGSVFMMDYKGNFALLVCCL